MRQFLSLGDGIIRNVSKKLIFSTNLPNLSQIDEALMRPGRCYGSVTTRRLQGEEIGKLAAKLGIDEIQLDKSMSVAEIYNLINKTTI
jgi:ATP-dependent 26S proteasome regulatory subunit